jgi:hypothetical protein
MDTGDRLAREKQTFGVMARIYCRGQHHTRVGICENCRSLVDYALERLERCVFQTKKPTCANCPIHCYHKDRREQVRVMMRYAGPRMLWTYPVLAIMHILDGNRKTPPVPRKLRRSPTD